MDAIQEKLVALAGEVGENLGYEVDDLELLGGDGRQLLRIIIDTLGNKAGDTPGDQPGEYSGITMDDCAAFSRDLSALLDVENPIKGRFTLEVSSPGLDRLLKKLSHYEKNLGKLVRVVPRQMVAGRNFLVGRLLEVDEEAIRLSVEGEDVVIPLDMVKKARLELEI
ncbi:MAG: ribosome maturation factor RimP [Thermodesulfovibrionales bacterium]|nr:ribosome maturation factor RimP [Thermodesulfovibrionales bacterium]